MDKVVLFLYALCALTLHCHGADYGDPPEADETLTMSSSSSEVLPPPVSFHLERHCQGADYGDPPETDEAPTMSSSSSEVLPPPVSFHPKSRIIRYTTEDDCHYAELHDREDNRDCETTRNLILAGKIVPGAIEVMVTMLRLHVSMNWPIVTTDIDKFYKNCSGSGSPSFKQAFAVSLVIARFPDNKVEVVLCNNWRTSHEYEQKIKLKAVKHFASYFQSHSIPDSFKITPEEFDKSLRGVEIIRPYVNSKTPEVFYPEVVCKEDYKICLMNGEYELLQKREKECAAMHERVKAGSENKEAHARTSAASVVKNNKTGENKVFSEVGIAMQFIVNESTKDVSEIFFVPFTYVLRKSEPKQLRVEIYVDLEHLEQLNKLSPETRKSFCCTVRDIINSDLQNHSLGHTSEESNTLLKLLGRKPRYQEIYQFCLDHFVPHPELKDMTRYVTGLWV
jgi:hypothetical protein